MPRVLILIPLTLTMVWCVSQASAQDEAETTAATETETKAAAELFPLPDGSADELLSFIEQVQQTPLPEGQRTREKSIGFFRAQIAAVLAACDKLDSMTPDSKTQIRVIEERFMAYQNLAKIDETAAAKLTELVRQYRNDQRPSIIRLISGYQLESATPGFFSLNDQQQTQLIDDLLIYMEQFGLDRTSYGVASALAEALESSGMAGPAVRVIDSLIRELRRTGDPRAAQQIARYEGTARRLKLPGSFMEVTGTTVDGEDFDWKSYRGKVVLVDFWASWCGPCRAEIPNMKAQFEKYSDKGFEIVGVSLDKTLDEYHACIDQEEISWISLMSQKENERGWDHPLAVHYGVSGIPLAILVDRDGKVVSMNATGAELNQLLAEILDDPTADDPAAE